MSSNKIFHHLLAQAGDEGRYQVIALVACFILTVEITSISILNSFLFYQDPYQCPSIIDNCHEYVCALPTEQQLTYVNPESSSMLSRFGNFRCETGGEPMTSQTIIYAGAVVSPLIAALLLKHLKQRQLFLLVLVVSIVGMTITLLSETLLMATIGLFLNFVSRGMMNGIGFGFMSEVTSENIRVKYNNWGYMGCGVGGALIGLVYWVVRPWEVAFALYQLLPMVALLALVLFVVVDTPFDAVTKGTPAEALRQFQKIARINGQ